MEADTELGPPVRVSGVRWPVLVVFSVACFVAGNHPEWVAELAEGAGVTTDALRIALNALGGVFLLMGSLRSSMAFDPMRRTFRRTRHVLFFLPVSTVTRDFAEVRSVDMAYEATERRGRSGEHGRYTLYLTLQDRSRLFIKRSPARKGIATLESKLSRVLGCPTGRS